MYVFDKKQYFSFLSVFIYIYLSLHHARSKLDRIISTDNPWPVCTTFYQSSKWKGQKIIIILIDYLSCFGVYLTRACVRSSFPNDFTSGQIFVSVMLLLAVVWILLMFSPSRTALTRTLEVRFSLRLAEREKQLVVGAIFKLVSTTNLGLSLFKELSNVIE